MLVHGVAGLDERIRHSIDAFNMVPNLAEAADDRVATLALFLAYSARIFLRIPSRGV